MLSTSQALVTACCVMVYQPGPSVIPASESGRAAAWCRPPESVILSDRLFDFMCLVPVLLVLAACLVSADTNYLCPLAFETYSTGSSSCVDYPIQVTSAAGCKTDITVKASIYPIPSVQQIVVQNLPLGANLILEALPPESQQFSSQDLINYMVGYNATFEWTPQLMHAGRKYHGQACP